MGAKSEGEILSSLSVGRSKETLTPIKGNVEMVMAKWGDGIIKALQKNLDTKNKNASSNLRQSINFQTKYFGFNLNFALHLADYYEWVDKGRKAGKMPPVDKIFNWIRNKPSVQTKVGWTRLPKHKKDALAFNMARAIGRRGTKASNFFSSVVNKSAYDRLWRDLKIAIGKDLQVNITEFKNVIKPA
jgi:hypothetical protein